MAGGTNSKDLTSSEIHRMDSEGFVQGPALPDLRFARGLTMITSLDNKNLILLGGYSGSHSMYQPKMYKLTCVKMRSVRKQDLLFMLR